MRFRTVFRVPECKKTLLLQSGAFRSYSKIQSTPERCFGIAFDIDGVILRGRVPIGGSPRALRRLYGDSGALNIPFLFLTNGGGIPESRRANELGELLGVHILPSQVVQGHTPFKNLLDSRFEALSTIFPPPSKPYSICYHKICGLQCLIIINAISTRYENELIVATGKGEPALVMSEYGFTKVLSLEEYASCFKNIDPVSQYKSWTTVQASELDRYSNELVTKHDVLSNRVKAAFVVSDPVDWGRDIQVLCDILRSGGLPGQKNGHQPPLYFAADDLEYQAAFPSERLGMGAFRTALESVFNRCSVASQARIHHDVLQYISFGKPNPFVFKNAEAILRQLQPSYLDHYLSNNGYSGSEPFKTLYMIGDNPLVDVKGAKQAGHPWFSILTRTGVFKGKDNHADFPADLVVDTVEEAVDYILKRESAS